MGVELTGNGDPDIGGAVAADGGFDTSGVVVAEQPELGGSSAVTARAFRAGERVFRERALVVAKAPTNLSRLRAYCALPTDAQRTLREEYWSESPAVRCAATAACRGDDKATGDSAADVLAALRAEGFSAVSLDEVELVIRVWNLNAYDCALAPVACKVSHSCAPNVFVHVDEASGSIEATACRPIPRGESLGSWYFQDTGLWWMGADVRRARLEADRGFLCGCARCRAPDECRALPCSACGAGTAVPMGAFMGAGAAAPPTVWRCSSCGREAAGDPIRLAAEAEIAPRALLELWPPRNAPRATPEELVALDLDVRARLGEKHWASAATSLVMYIRVRPPGGALDAFAVACGCSFVGFLVDRGLPAPPAAIVRTPIAVTVDCASWLVKAAGDRRCIVGRLLTQFLLPIYDASGAPIAKVANTGARIEELRAWLEKLKDTCGNCGQALKGGAAPLACSRCKQVRYCSRGCQQADWKVRHKAGCLPASEPLSGAAARRVLLAPAAD